MLSSPGIRRWQCLGMIIGALAGWVSLMAQQSAGVAPHVLPKPPRTMVIEGRQKDFRAYCTKGEGAKAFAKIKADYDKDYLKFPFPDEPVTYGDPDPKNRDSDKADKWRDVQDLCGRVSAITEAATLIWIVTGEEKYFTKAKEFLIKSCAWHFAPDWKNGPVVGATDVYYNDEANFRLWRKLPLVYDQLRAKLTPEERKTILAHFKERGDRTVEWIKAAKVEQIQRNSLDVIFFSCPRGESDDEAHQTAPAPRVTASPVVSPPVATPEIVSPPVTSPPEPPASDPNTPSAPPNAEETPPKQQGRDDSRLTHGRYCGAGPFAVGASAQQVFVDAAGDAGQHSLPRHGMFLAAMLPAEIQQGRVFLITRA